MNLFHGGRLATMPPKLLNEEGDVFVYRPLAHVAEADCETLRARNGLPHHPLRSLRLVRTGLQRQQVKAILDGWEKNSPGRRQVMFRALMNARPSHLLDPKAVSISQDSTRDLTLTSLGEQSLVDIPHLFRGYRKGSPRCPYEDCSRSELRYRSFKRHRRWVAFCSLSSFLGAYYCSGGNSP